jgi:hypothetical protein
VIVNLIPFLIATSVTILMATTTTPLALVVVTLVAITLITVTFVATVKATTKLSLRDLAPSLMSVARRLRAIIREAAPLSATPFTLFAGTSV